MGVLDKLDTASVGHRDVEIILDAALQAQWDELNRQLDDAITDDSKGVVGEGASLAMPATTRVIDEMDEIRERVLASRVTFRMEPVDWRARLPLQADHPPREGNLIDQVRGYNIETFTPALIRASCVKVVDSDGDEATDIPDEKWLNLLGDPTADPPVKPKLTANQVAQLFAGAQEADQGVTQVPPSARFLLDSQDFGASLAQPSPGTSPRSDSAGGSPRTSRKSSTAKKAPAKKAKSSGS